MKSPQAVGKVVGKAMLPIILQLTAGLLTTQVATIPVFQSPTLVYSIKTSQNSDGNPTAIQQTIESGNAGSVGKQLYTYMLSGNTKDSRFGALTEAPMPAAS